MSTHPFEVDIYSAPHLPFIIFTKQQKIVDQLSEVLKTQIYLILKEPTLHPLLPRQ